MLAGNGFQVVNHFHAAFQTNSSDSHRVFISGDDCVCCLQHQAEYNQSREEESERVSAHLEYAQLPYASYKKSEESTHRRGNVVRQGPGQREKREDVEKESGPENVEFLSLAEEIESGNDEKQVPPEIGLGDEPDFSPRHFSQVRPGVVIKISLPTIVEIVELRIVVPNGRPWRLPDKDRAGVVELLIQGHGKRPWAASSAPIVVTDKTDTCDEHGNNGQNNFAQPHGPRRRRICFAEHPPEKNSAERKGKDESFVRPAIRKDRCSSSEGQSPADGRTPHNPPQSTNCERAGRSGDS